MLPSIASALIPVYRDGNRRPDRPPSRLSAELIWVALSSSRRKAFHPFLTAPKFIALMLILLRCKLTAKAKKNLIRHHALGVLRPNDYPCFVRMAYVGRIAMRQSAQLVLFVSLTFFTGAAHAVDRGQFENVPDDVRRWFKSVRSPAGVPCCDISDGHRTEYDLRAGAYWVPINGL